MFPIGATLRPNAHARGKTVIIAQECRFAPLRQEQLATPDNSY
jgi:hypothetical protein